MRQPSGPIRGIISISLSLIARKVQEKDSGAARPWIEC
jgi:hypothetical protein